MSNTIQPYRDGTPPANDGLRTAPNGGSGNTPTDIFAKLLTAQIRNQNPLEPTDPSQFVSQIMQAQQTEALNAVASLTANNAALMESLLVVSLGSQVGSRVMARTEAVDVGGDKVDGRIALDDAESAVTVVLTDSSGKTHRIELGAQQKGDVQFSIDPKALGLTSGRYRIKVETESGAKPPVAIEGTLDNVRLGSDGKVVMHVSGIGDVDTASIRSFMGRRSTNQTNKERA